MRATTIVDLCPLKDNTTGQCPTSQSKYKRKHPLSVEKSSNTILVVINVGVGSKTYHYGDNEPYQSK